MRAHGPILDNTDDDNELGNGLNVADRQKYKVRNIRVKSKRNDKEDA